MIKTMFKGDSSKKRSKSHARDTKEKKSKNVVTSKSNLHNNNFDFEELPISLHFPQEQQVLDANTQINQKTSSYLTSFHI